MAEGHEAQVLGAAMLEARQPRRTGARPRAGASPTRRLPAPSSAETIDSVQQPYLALIQLFCEQPRSELHGSQGVLRDKDLQLPTLAQRRTGGRGGGWGSPEVSLEEAAGPGGAGGGSDSSQLQIKSANGFSSMRKAGLIMTNHQEQQAKR